MELIDYVTQRVGTLGYRYEREYFDVKALPVTMRPKTCFVNLIESPENNEFFQLRSTAPIKMVRTGITLNFVDERRGLDLGEYTSSMKAALSAMLVNTGTGKIPGVTLVEITRNTYVETGEYIVFVVEIHYQEILP
jgi:hypothetical protein